MNYLEQRGVRAKKAATELNRYLEGKKNDALRACAKALLDHETQILSANEKDVAAAKERGVKSSLIDRLSLNHQRLQSMADGLLEICTLADPIGEVISMKVRPNGLNIGQKVVPLGVIGIIYESRPNVTADAFGLCFKTGNAVILRGGSDAIHSNTAIVEALRMGLASAGCIEDAVQLIEDTSRETARNSCK